MLGSLLAGLEESPGEVVLLEGRQFKEYRGMGSMGALQGYGKDRYGSGQAGAGKLVPEGIEGRVPYKGFLHDFVYQLVGGLRSGMGYAGAEIIGPLAFGNETGPHHQCRPDRKPSTRCHYHQGSTKLPVKPGLKEGEEDSVR